MKKLVGLALLGILFACTTTKDTGIDIQSLDTTIYLAGTSINNALPEGTKVALLNFNSTSDALSDYVLEELSIILVNGGKLIIVDRSEIDLLRSEMNFQWSGEVSDESAQEIGEILGAESIVSGSLVDMGGAYRFRTKVINVSNARIQASSSFLVGDDPIIRFLLAQNSRASTPQTAAGGRTQSASTPAPAPARVVPLRWTIDQFKDQWGDGTGRYYMKFDGTIVSEYQDVWDLLNININSFIFSKRDGLSMEHSRFEALISTQGVYLDVKKSNGDSMRFTGRILAWQKVITIPYSDELADFLSDSGAKVIYQCNQFKGQFDMPPRFAEAYELLLSREN